MKNIAKIKKYFFLRLPNKRGFTLLEILVSVSLFTVTILLVTEIFSVVMGGQRNTLASQNIQESMRYALEVMGKEIRMAQPNNGDCKKLFNPEPVPSQAVYNVAIDDSGKQILYFLNQNNICVAYYLSEERLNIMRDYNGAAITPNSVKISGLNFFIHDNLINDPNNNVQPMATIKIEAEAKGLRSGNQKIILQTSISSKNYE